MASALVVLFALAMYAAVDAEPGKAPLLNLNDGHKIPQLALGTFVSPTGIKDDQLSAVRTAVSTAITLGYRHIDTASIYGTEQPVGQGVADAIKSGEVKREDVFVTTKLWNDKHAESAVVPALRESLGKLGFDYVDLYLIHWPFGHDSSFKFDDTDFVETWRGMVEAQRLGLARSIGVSNFNKKQLERLIASSDVKPAVLQVEVNLNLQQEELREFCASQGIVIMAYTPFGTLFGPKRGNDAPGPRADDPALVAIGEKYGKSVTQVALRYLLDLGVIPLPKSISEARLRANIDVFDFSLSDEDRQTLKAFDKGFRSYDVTYWQEAKEFPFEKKAVPSKNARA